MERIDEREGRQLFGLDAARYDQVRPPYPEAFVTLLESEAVLFPGARTLEIGAGSGTATRRLIAAGADPVTVIEPDTRFSAALQELRAVSPNLTLLNAAFEDAELDAGAFDLAVAATSFHWLDPERRIDKLAAATRPGGCVVLVWNLFQDLDREDAFHEATRRLLEHLAASPSGAPDTLPFALDRAARESEFCADGRFQRRVYAEIRWTLELNVAEVRSLYQTFSSIARLPALERDRLLDRLCEVAAKGFGGRVVRHMTTPIYVFTRA